MLAMLLFASLLESFWDEVALTEMDTINRLLLSILDNCTSYELLYDMSREYIYIVFFKSLVVLFYASLSL